MSSSIQRLNIFSLYRVKLRLCLSMGHVCGNWNKIYEYKIHQLSTKINTQTISHYKNPGLIIWNNIRNQYKMNIHESNSTRIDKLIDSGFRWLMQINKFFKIYKQTPYYTSLKMNTKNK